MLADALDLEHDTLTDARGSWSAESSRLNELEDESIYIIREVMACFRRPVLLYSIGKDSSVLLHLLKKACHPCRPKVELLHVDTTWKFREMIEFRDKVASQEGVDLHVHVNESGIAIGVRPDTHGATVHTDIMKTQALKQALQKWGFDAAIGGARRDEEKSRAKERVFSFRNAAHGWNPHNQRVEVWANYNSMMRPGESVRAFPLANWTELDVWLYILREEIDVLPLYFAKLRPVVSRREGLIMVDDDRLRIDAGESVEMKMVRFRSLGCYPLTSAIESSAASIEDIIHELRSTHHSERGGRLIDGDPMSSLERKKIEGYF